jgi:hypothetical protein
MSMFLESKKEINNGQEDQEEENNKLSYHYSLNKYEPNLMNAYRVTKERSFQKALLPQLQNTV